MAEEMEFPKIDGDTAYASEYNSFVTTYTNGIFPCFNGEASDGDLVYSVSADLTKILYHCDSLTINSGVTMTVPLTKKIVVFVVEGDVNIEGTLTATGNGIVGGLQVDTGTVGIGTPSCSVGLNLFGVPAISYITGKHWSRGGAGGSFLTKGGDNSTNRYSYPINNYYYGVSVSNSIQLNLIKEMMLNGWICLGSGAAGSTSDRYSGGSSGNGGNSGGAIYILCKGKMTVSGSIISDGTSGKGGRANVGTQVAAGSGGAGGFIVLRSYGDMDLTDATITANGGNSNFEPTYQDYGFGGSGGFIGISSKGTYTAPTTLTVTGGLKVAPKGDNGDAGITYINGA